MSLRARLTHPDPAIRLEAAAHADRDDPEIVALLLDLALNDTAEVRTMGGLAEAYESVSDAAAATLGRVLGRRSGIDDRLRAALIDPDADDERAAKLLYYLRSEPLRRELEGHSDPRVRLRALTAIPPSQRSADIRGRLITDPDPRVRAEALNVPRADAEECVRLMRTDPAPIVRRAAAMAVRFTPAVGSEPFIAVLHTESDPSVRAMLLSCLTYRPRDRVNAEAIASFLDDGDRFLRSQAVQALRTVRDAAIAALIAEQIEVEDDLGVLMGLLRQPRLLAYAPQLRAFLEQRRPRSDGERHALDAALASGDDLVELRFPDDKWIAVAFGEQRRAIGEAPVEAARIVLCSHCESGVRVTGLIEWRYRDDDHFAYSEDGYEADLRGACHRCATAARRIVLVTGERSRSTDILTLSCQDLRLA